MKKLLLFLFFFGAITGYSQEICDNGIDDDADGLIDFQDTTDCKCAIMASTGAVASLIPNPNFELRTCCPSGLSQLNCANTWSQASSATSDYFNTCGTRKIGVTTFAFPPTPLPGNGNGYVGFYNGSSSSTTANNYKEYVGTCLLDTMHAGTSYKIEFYVAQSTGNMTAMFEIFGTANCANLPFGGFSCPTNGTGWIAMDSATVTMTTTAWTKVTLTFTPTINVTAIVLGPNCAQMMGRNYYFADSLIMNATSSFSPVATIKDTGHYCQNNLVLSAKFDSLPKRFQWYKNGIALVGDTNSTYAVSPGGTGDYQIRLLYDSGCVFTAIYKVDTTIIDFDYDTAGSCLAGNTGQIKIKNMRGGTTPYKFRNGISPLKTDSTFKNLKPGFYSIRVQDSNLCYEFKTINVKEFPKPTADFATDSACLGFPTTFTDKSSVVTGIIKEWKWFLPGTPVTQNTTYISPVDGTFPVKLEVMSDSGCINDTTITVIVHPLPVPNFDHNPKEIYVFDTKICFSNSSTGATGYYWDFRFSGINGTSTNNAPCLVTFPNSKGATYNVKLIAITQFGCIDSIFKDVIILEGFLLYIPNSFSPNDDGVNETLVISTDGISEFDFRIFNRWGEEIYHTTDATKSWDGKHENVLVPNGNYVYKVLVTSKTGVTKEIIGHINVLK